MVVLSVIERELRVSARRAATYRLRFAMVLVALVVMAWIVFSAQYRADSGAFQGRRLFTVVATLAFFYCLYGGARLTADCISSEKRDGTLGLLFLTDLKGMHIVFGKLIANSLNAFYGLMAILPALAIPLMLGGVTVQQFLQVALVLVNTLFFAVSIGIFASTLSRNDRKAVFAAVMIVSTVLFVPVAVGGYLIFVYEFVQNRGDLVLVASALMPSPAFALFHVFSPFIPFLTLPMWMFWVSLGLFHLLGWLALLMAGWLLPRVWKDRTEAASNSNWRVRAQQWWRGSVRERFAFRKRFLDINPFLWLVSRDFRKPRYAWLFLVANAGTWTWGYFRYGSVMFDFYPFIPTIVLIHGFLQLWVSAEASQRLVEDYRNGALEMLLSTPLRTSQIIEGQVLALRWQFLKPLCVLAVAELIVFRGYYSVWMILLASASLAVGMWAMLWVSVRLSLTARSTGEVIARSMGLILLLPWALFLFIRPFAERVSLWADESPLDRPQAIYVWCAVSVLNSLFWGFYWARPQVLKRFRHIALARFDRSEGRRLWFLGKSKPEPA